MRWVSSGFFANSKVTGSMSSSPYGRAGGALLALAMGVALADELGSAVGSGGSGSGLGAAQAHARTERRRAQRGSALRARA